MNSLERMKEEFLLGLIYVWLDVFMLLLRCRKMGVLNYNTLIRSGDADQLKECKGQVVAVLCSKQSDDASGAVTIEAKSFDATVPRNKWTHVAIVASDRENSNRLTLYIVRESTAHTYHLKRVISSCFLNEQDGDIMKSLKQSSFPMPMASLCGSGNGASVNGKILFHLFYHGIHGKRLASDSSACNVLH